jgi:hypothetical protein
MVAQYPVTGRTTRAGGHKVTMTTQGETTQPDPADGTLVQREGVDAGSDRSTAEGEGTVPSAESALTGGSTTGRRGDRPEGEGPETTPSQTWSEDTGGVADPEAPYGTESGQDTGSIA